MSASWLGAKPSTREIVCTVLRSDESVPKEVIDWVSAVLAGKVAVEKDACTTLLTMSAAARKVGYSRTWFWEKVTREGNRDGASFPPVETAPGEFRYRLSDIEAFLARTAPYAPKRRQVQGPDRNKKSKG